ncbi:ferredoxin--NADP reductase [Agrobacterium rhizogenes]|uniref:ferredoxin--NADP reductase n=1 Tax=Rhizobium rhizogenes TaxID=359 RepID=UPI0015724B02|nr:ferredoxin--NADP reductase [Rhizobium rhizogenes]NTF53013.1 ferredoxin--NADP reductase [Rhizobium rhizogenes]NTF65950.1 ferredoxin--NADP reductase [Rhizobium rhizogenes]NTF98047.1 ferredoxin--NADP reductase [Rhizobium rhizogenes]NTG05172.1 ferredoxin--NADP reductase [Rhizobium rhizogenes]NTG18466.1 ferredoxin--NADP reductase [Rhizobium rhizogenes]
MLQASVVTGQPNTAFYKETVTSVKHWTESLFSFKITRDPGFRFVSGQFVMLGLILNGKPLLRAYSIASPSHANELEFYSIKVPDGPLTSRLGQIREGDEVLVGRKPTGTLVLDGLNPGRNLFLVSTGTGLAPFIGLAQDPETYDRFDKVVISHTVRQVADLNYHELLCQELQSDEYLGELVTAKLAYYPSVTREPFRNQGRITDLIQSGKIFSDLKLPVFDPACDRVMLCGGPSVLGDLKTILHVRGFKEGSVSNPGEFVLERAFVEA